MLPDLTQYVWIAWLVLVFLFVIIELLTLEFTFLMLAAGSLVGGLGVFLLGGPWWLQVAVAAVLSAVLLFTIRPLLLRALKRGYVAHPTNVDALVGMPGRVLSPFAGGSGSVKLDNGETWTARLAPGAELPALDVGDAVDVVAVHGATAVVRPTGTPSPGAPSPAEGKD